MYLAASLMNRKVLTNDNCAASGLLLYFSRGGESNDDYLKNVIKLRPFKVSLPWLIVVAWERDFSY